MRQIGNHNANLFWESRLQDRSIISADMNERDRKQHIENKYKHKKYFSAHALSTNKKALNEKLLQVAATDDVLQLYSIIFSGADVSIVIYCKYSTVFAMSHFLTNCMNANSFVSNN